MKAIKIFTLVASAMIFGATSAFAAKPCDKAAQCTQTCQNKKEACKAQKTKCDAKQNCQKRQAMETVLFEGIVLTPEQKTAIDTINARQLSKMQITRQTAKLKKDSIRAEKKEGKMANRRAIRQEYLNQVKEVLTPEQYVVFLENAYTVQPAGRQGNHAKFNKQATPKMRKQK